MPWLRLWVDVLDDPDLSDLPEATCWCWTLMLAAAKKFNREGELPPLKTLAHWMRKPRDRVARLIVELTEAGMLESSDGVISVHGWERWQQHKDQTNAVRQAKFRARKKAASRAPAPAPAPAGNSDSDSETETDAETLRNAVTPLRNGEVTEENAPPAPPLVPSNTPECKRVAELAIELGCDFSWGIWANRQYTMGISPVILEAALHEAVNANKLSQPYVGRIAARFKQEGLPRPINGKVKLHDPGPVNQPVSAHNPPPDLDQFKAKADESRRRAKAQGMDV